jgi:hypothetical protein
VNLPERASAVQLHGSIGARVARPLGNWVLVVPLVMAFGMTPKELQTASVAPGYSRESRCTRDVETDRQPGSAPSSEHGAGFLFVGAQMARTM